MNNLVLASGSPRRKDILSLLKIPFDIIVSDIDETIDTDKPVKEEIERLSFNKAQAVFVNHQDCIVIGSDTVVTLDNKILGKPKDEEDAFRMLSMLQGRAHEVLTSVTIISKEHTETFSSIARVYFAPMSEEEIRGYIATGEPADKAGGYAVQGIGGRFVEKIDGDYYTIVGLPLHEIYIRLKKYSD